MANAAQRRRNRVATGGDRPRNAEIAGVKVSFRPRNNLQAEPQKPEWMTPGLIAGVQENSPEEPKMRQNSWRAGPGPNWGAYSATPDPIASSLDPNVDFVPTPLT